MPLSDLTPACIALLTAGSAGDEPEVAEVAEDSVKDLRKTCRICSQYFDTLAAQRQHFQSQEHTKKLQESQEDSDIDDGSDDEEERAEDAGPSRIKISSADSQQSVTLYKAILTSEKHLSAARAVDLLTKFTQDTRPYWLIIILSGGRFAAAIFDIQSGATVAHKCITKYTTRRKQGGGQRARDASGGKAIKSAGAQLRRHNEAQMDIEVRACLGEWRQLLAECRRVFVYLPGRFNKQTVFHDPQQVLDKGDDRVVTVPFMTYRPTLEEVKRIDAKLRQ